MFDAFTGVAGRLLSYTRSDNAWSAAAATANHQASGLVLLGPDAVTETRRLRARRSKQLLVVDVGEWSKTEGASAVAPVLPGEPGLFPSDGVDVWASSVINAGADVVLTRSLFVPVAAWEALRAVLRAGAKATRPDVMTLVATDAAMLDRVNLSEFLRMLASEYGSRPLAFVFAGTNQPMARHERMRGLRALLGQHPGSLLVGVDVLAATDAITRGAGAAIGITGSLRRPKRPKDPNGGGSAANFVPGLFLRELWETRSPTIYADWYANKQAPTCTACAGRSMDSFTNDAEDKRQILTHNIHTWLAVLAEIRQADQAEDWLKTERLRALDAHAELQPRGQFEADRLLRVLCELDDPERRRTRVTGQWI